MLSQGMSIMSVVRQAEKTQVSRKATPWPREDPERSWLGVMFQ